MKVLLIAEAANPEWTSVPLEGWNYVKEISKVADTHVVTHKRNKEAFERAGLTEGDDFTAIDSDAVDRPLYRLSEVLRGGQNKGWTIVTAFASIGYYYFEHLLWKRFGKEIKANEFDVVHRVTPLSPTAVSTIAAKCARSGVPFIVGPLNGGLPWPKQFKAVLAKENEWLSYCRDIYKLLPGRKRYLDSCTAIIAGSKATAESFPSRYEDKLVEIAENGFEVTKVRNREQKREYDIPLQLLFVGRLVPYKGCDMVLDAIAELAKQGAVVLRIVGDGPERETLEKLTAKLEINDYVTFTGNINHELVYEEMNNADILSFPSIREFGGGVVVEAMATFCVPLIVDYGGPADIVDSESALLVPLGDRESIVAGLQEKLETVLADPSVLAEYAAKGRLRVVELFSWERKAEQILEVYNWSLDIRSKKPDFGFNFRKKD